MDEFFSKTKSQTTADADNIFLHEQSSDNRSERNYNTCESNNFIEHYTGKLTECMSTFSNISKEMFKHIKEYPNMEQMEAAFSCLNSEIRKVEGLVQSNCSDFGKIRNETNRMKDELLQIKRLINSPSHGLSEIKKELRSIEKELSARSQHCPNVTSGSVIIEDPCTTQLLVAVKNPNLLAHTVRIKVLRDDICPATALSDTCLLVSGRCSNAITVPLSCMVSYEIEVYGLMPGMSVSSIELDVCKRRIKCSRLTFSQFFCLTENC